MRGIKKSGFTLLEVLVALFIFTIIAVIMTNALHHIFTLQHGTEKKAERLAKLQMALILFSNDIQQTVVRPVRNHSGGEELPLMGTSTRLSITHGGIPNPNGELLISSLQRTNYFLKKNSLIRETFEALDQAPLTQSDEADILSAITQLHFEYYDTENQPHTSWPPAQMSHTSLPKAVRVSLTLDGWGEINQLFIIPGSSFEAKASN